MSTKFLFLYCIFFLHFYSEAQEIEHSHSSSHSFIENKGQWDEDVLFKSHFDGGNLWVEQNKMMFHLQDFSDLENAHVNSKVKIPKNVNLPQTLVHLNFIGSNTVNEIERFIPTSNYFNFFIGNDESKWAQNVRGYGEAIMHDLYDGIDFKIIEKLEQLKYEFHVKPNINANQIVLEYVGQNNIEINRKGDLIVKTDLGEIIEQKPYAYQVVNGRIREVECDFVLSESEVTFKLGNYNPNVVLVIDPVLIFATYSGSVTDNFGMTATYGNDGTAYSGGMIYGNSYPTPDPLAFNTTSNFTVPNNATYGITDAFVSKYSPDGSTMLWTTFIGGGDGVQGTETAQSMICDPSNNLYLYGATSSIDFPIVGGYQATHAGGEDSLDFYQNGVHFKDQGTDIYVAKISENGNNLLASTYIGGSSNDGVNYRDNMPYYTYGTYAQFSEYDSLTLNYGDQFRGEIYLDKNGNCLVASCTKSTDFPVQSAFQPTNAGLLDGVIFQLNSSLSTMQWSSYYGGSNNDACYSVKVDSTNHILMAGGTTSSDLTNTLGGWQPTYNGGIADGFVSRITPDGLTILQSSYIGTANYDQTFFVEVDRANNVYMVGQSRGGLFPVINSGFVNPGSGQYIIKMDSTLTNVISSTVFGDGNPDFDISPSAFLVDICGNIYVSGWGAHLLQSSDVLANMPVSSNAYQSTAPNGFDFYLIVLERDFSDILYGSYLGGNIAREHVDGGTSRFDKNGVVYQSVCGGCGGNSDFPTWPDPGVWSDTNLSTNCNNLVFKFDFELIPNAEFTVDNNIGCRPFTVTYDNFSTQSDSYLWDFGNGDTSSVIFNPTIVYDSVGVFTTYLYVTDSICLLTDTAEIVITVYDSLQLFTSPDMDICVPEQIDLVAYTNGTGDSFIWSSNINFTDTINSGITDSVWTMTPDTSAVYYIQVYNSGCSRIDSVRINMQLLPVSDFTIDDTSGCVPVMVSFSNLSTIPDSHLWDFGNGITSGVLDTTITYNSAGVYTAILSVTNVFCNITDSAEVIITVLDSVNLTVPPDQVMCDPITLPLTASTNGTADNFIWSTNINFSDTLNSSVSDSVYISNPTTPTVFYIQAGNDECSKIDSVFITFQSALIELTANDSICSDETTWIYSEITNPNITFSNYIWGPSSVLVSSNNQTSIEVNPDTTQYIYLTALSSTGCSINDSILIYVGDIPQSAVSASASDYVIPEGGTVTLYGEPSGYSYLWMPSVVENPIGQQTEATIDQTTLFTLFITDGVCTKSDTVLVKTYEFQCDDPYLFVPNAFTPNGDGENDVLYVRGPAIKKMVFRIYDRWGELVFESFERPFGWDGRFRGKLMNPDVYDYYLKVTCVDDAESIIKGNFTLIR